MADLIVQRRDRQVRERALAARLTGLLERRSGAGHDFLGDGDEFAVLGGLLPKPLRGTHPLESLHAPTRRARAIAEPLDAPLMQLAEPIKQMRQHAHGIPQQRAIGRIMDVGLHHRRVDTQLRAAFQPKIDRRLHHKGVDRPQCCRRQAHEGAVESVVLGHRPAAEPGKQA